MVVCGLDSITARRWINSMLLSLLEFDDAGDLKQHTMIPMIDGGTEGALLSVSRASVCFSEQSGRGCKREHAAMSDPTAPAPHRLQGQRPRPLSRYLSLRRVHVGPLPTAGREAGIGRRGRGGPAEQRHYTAHIRFPTYPLSKINFPMCTIANTPRLPEHCIEYVKVCLRSVRNC